MKNPVVYVAAPFAYRDWALSIAEELVAHGCSVNSDWLFSGATIDTERGNERMLAQKDLGQVTDADVLALCLPPPEWQILQLLDEVDSAFSRRRSLQEAGSDILRRSGFTGGCFHEAQHAISHGVPLVVMGDERNIFLRGLSAHRVDDPQELAAWILSDAWRAS